MRHYDAVMINKPPALQREGWPEWMVNGYDLMAGLEGSDRFQDALLFWVALERDYQFEDQVSNTLHYNKISN